MKALEGIRVIDLSMWAFGPSCGAVLADWGAEVIHVEDITGDPTRGILAIGGVYLPKGDFPWPFHLCNRGKKSLAVDLRKEEGREIIYKLCERSDVFLTNFIESTLKRLRVDYETLSKINPRLIYAHVSGYGERGEEKERPGYDYAAFWARGGIMGHLGEPGSLPPPQLPALGDQISALCLAGGIALALFHRERTGEGQKIALSLLGSAVWMNSWQVQAMLSTGEEYPKLSRKEATNPLWNYYRARDGKWFYLVCLQSDRYWDGFCKAIGREDLRDNPKFNTHEKRMENNKELISILDELFLTKDRDEWGRLFDENGVLWAPIQTCSEVVRDPQVIANEFIVEVEDPEFGKVKLVKSPLQMEKTPAAVEKTAPQFAQHNEEIMLELGYSWDEIKDLKEKGVIV